MTDDDIKMFVCKDCGDTYHPFCCMSREETLEENDNVYNDWVCQFCVDYKEFVRSKKRKNITYANTHIIEPLRFSKGAKIALQSLFVTSKEQEPEPMRVDEESYECYTCSVSHDNEEDAGGGGMSPQLK